MQEEFRAINSENLMTMKRMISDYHLEVMQPLTVIQAGIEKNLKEEPGSVKLIAIKGNEIEEEMAENNNAQL
jgi:hypothetical protein